jgi:phosphoribosylformylglycinamidine synthase
VLTEAGLLPGALRRNSTLRFEHRWVRLSVESHDTPFTRGIPPGHTLRLPIAHGEGNYYLPEAELDALEQSGQVAFRYAPPEGNPNGSARDIAGVTDPSGRICGLMPHPERASEALLGSDDGLLLLRSMVESAARVEVAA